MPGQSLNLLFCEFWQCLDYYKKMNTISVIEHKYGSFVKVGAYFCNCKIQGTSNYLNYLFVQPNISNIITFFEHKDLRLESDLKDFYKQFNGLSFFMHSLVIYGFTDALISGPAPLDIRSMNRFLSSRNPNWDEGYISIGCYSSYEFCLKSGIKSGNIFVVERSSNKIIAKFCSFNEILSYCLNKISSFYQSNGLKNNLNYPLKKWTDNMSFENIF